MRKLRTVVSLAIVSFAALGSLGGHSSAADTHVIQATAQANWKSDGRESDGISNPLVVAVRKGDILEIRVPGGVHGMVTLDRKGSETSPRPNELRTLVQTCGEDAPAKPNAVFREIECQGGTSNFAKRFVGVMKLEVLDAFQNEVYFWCVEHTSEMWGTIQLKL
jgi:hypothetical protein